MTRRYIWVLIVFGLLGMGYWGRSLSSNAMSTTAIEYKVIRVSPSGGSDIDAADESLNKLGAQGWELILVIPERVGSPNNSVLGYYYLKRVKK